MKGKLIGILVMALLIAPTVTVIGMELKMEKRERHDDEIKYDSISCKHGPQFLPPWWLIGVDQKQLIGEWGLWVIPQKSYAQEFKPTKDKLTAVALEFFKGGNPPDGVEISVTIRTSLDGEDLTEKTINADIIKKLPERTWVMFDFEDITVTPENTYYIICNGNGGDIRNASYWIGSDETLYTRGNAWESRDSGETWIEFQSVDFCFITYWQKPLNSAINNPILNWLLSHPHMFPILQMLFHRFGLQ
jgi:hypothetical protein